jgi:hypothetical protein
MPWTEDDLFQCLKADFGGFGDRAVSFLVTARQLLGVAQDIDVPRLPEAAIYCVREALKEIPLSMQADQDRPSWRKASRDVVAGRDRFLTARGVPGSDESGALDELLQSITALEAIHDQSGIHQERLISLMVARSGTPPLSADVDPVSEYQILITRADNALHSSASLDLAISILESTLALLARLFLPPDVRFPETDALALLPTPSRGDAETLVSFISTPVHLDRFFRKAISGDWLFLLDPSGVAATPASGPWPVLHMVDRLTDGEREKLSRWLRREFESNKRDADRCRYLTQAALKLPTGRPLLLDILHQHPGDQSIARQAAWSLNDAAPDSEFVVELADLLLSTSSGLGDHIDGVTDRLVAGVNRNNWSSRIELLTYKLRPLSSDEMTRIITLGERAGSISEPLGLYSQERFPILLQALTRAVATASRLGVSTAELENCLGGLPDDIRSRIEPWLLGIGTDVTNGLIIERLSGFISMRYPLGDDLALIDRVVTNEDPDAFVDSWRNALGAPPTPAAVAANLRKEGPSVERWVQVRAWSAVLPSDVFQDWSGALDVLRGAFGPISRSALEVRTRVTGASGTSPISSGQINEMSVANAAQSISEWRPDPAQFLVSARELGRAMEFDIGERVDEWTENPVQVVSILHHPTYIAHYFIGVALSSDLASANVDGILDALSVTAEHPWDVSALGTNAFEYDQDWSGVDEAAITLVKRLADADVLDSERFKPAWNFVLGAIRDRSKEAAFSIETVGPLESAINRPWPRALEAMFSLMASEYRVSGTFRDEALVVLEDLLALDGTDGTHARAVIAARYAFLHFVATDWTVEHDEQLFGEQAPGGLGQLTVDQVLIWSRPHPWILEHRRSGIIDATSRGLERGLYALLLGMLWGVEGYEPGEVFGVVRELGASIVSQSGEHLGRMLMDDSSDRQHVDRGVAFWQIAIADGSPSLTGFGWWSEVLTLDHSKWLNLTKETVARTRGDIDWSDKVASRSATPPSRSGFEILLGLIMGLPDAWHRDRVMGIAAKALGESDPELRASDEYRRLRQALLERGLYEAEDA